MTDNQPRNQTSGENEKKSADFFGIASYVFAAICLAIAAYSFHLLKQPGNGSMLKRLLFLEEVFMPCLGASVLMTLFWDFKHAKRQADAFAGALHDAKEFIDRKKAWIKWQLGSRKGENND